MKLTGFQSMMSCWERWHPVNAVQLVRTAGTVSVTRFADAVWTTLAKLEVATQGRWRMGFGKFPPGPSELCLDTSDFAVSGKRFEQFVSNQMNWPFRDSDLPVRFGILETADSSDGEATVVWLCYRHMIADARSMALLMQHVLEELRASSETSLDLRLSDEAEYGRLRACFRSGGGFIASIWSSLNSLLSFQKCTRRSPRDISDFRMEFQIHGESLPVVVLRQRASCLGITVGEYFTACVLEWLRDLPGRDSAHCCPGSRSVSVLADVTARAGGNARMVFGQHICPITVTDHSRTADEASLPDVVREQMRGKNILEKSIRNLRGLKWNSWLLPFYPGRTGLWLQEMLFPLGAAISNVNLNSMLPPERTATAATAYWRSTCATQFCPVIVCLTTLGDTCTLTSTHFPSYYADSEIRMLGRTLLARLFGANELNQGDDAICVESPSSSHDFSEKNLSCAN